MRLPEEINVNELVSITKNTFTTTGTIDDPSNLANARVWLLRYFGVSYILGFSLPLISVLVGTISILLFFFYFLLRFLRGVCLILCVCLLVFFLFRVFFLYFHSYFSSLSVHAFISLPPHNSAEEDSVVAKGVVEAAQHYYEVCGVASIKGRPRNQLSNLFNGVLEENEDTDMVE